MSTLSNYQSVATALFVKLDIPNYPTPETYAPVCFSDHNKTMMIAGDVYSGIGKLVSITQSQSEIRASGNQLTLTMVGIQNTDVPALIDSKLKGSRVEVRRAFLDVNTGALLPIAGNPAGRFFGLVNNYSLEEEWPVGNGVVTNALQIICTSVVDILNNKYSGRRTNPIDQRALYPSDTSMDRVLSLANSNFNFGEGFVKKG